MLLWTICPTAEQKKQIRKDWLVFMESGFYSRLCVGMLLIYITVSGMPGDTSLTSEGGEAALCLLSLRVSELVTYIKPLSVERTKKSTFECIRNLINCLLWCCIRHWVWSGNIRLHVFYENQTLKLPHGVKPLGEGKGSSFKDGLGYVSSPSKP